MEDLVVIIVKAPNQQIEDQTIHCEINWTIKKLKGHLSEVYPNKPRQEDQKLIYSGQLLNDSVILKDVLRVYEGQENHTVHLVCSPHRDTWKSTSSSSKKPTQMSDEQPVLPQEQTDNSSSSSVSGLRHRGDNIYGSAQPTSWPFTFTQPAGQTPAPMWPMMGDSASAAQQMAWMQQAYAQYMTQYMQLMASGNFPAGMQMPATMNEAPSATHPPPLREEPGPANEAVPNAEEEDARGNRDWLDWFYIMSRMLVLFSIVYFYSSPVRFFFVSTLGFIMYLYQIGFFRGVQRLEQQEEVPITPPPTPDNNNIPQPDNPPPLPPTALAITWAAFSSFFLSLIPEQPNVL